MTDFFVLSQEKVALISSKSEHKSKGNVNSGSYPIARVYDNLKERLTWLKFDYMILMCNNYT